MSTLKSLLKNDDVKVKNNKKLEIGGYNIEIDRMNIWVGLTNKEANDTLLVFGLDTLKVTEGKEKDEFLVTRYG